MKKLIFIIAVFFYLPTYAQNTTGTNVQQQGQNLADEPAQTVKNQGGQGASIMAAGLVDRVYGGASAAGQLYKTINDFKGRIQNSNSFAELVNVLSELEDIHTDSCEDISEKSASCCSDPKGSGCATSSWADAASMGVQVLGTVAATTGGGGAAAQGCLDSLGKLAEASKSAGGGKQACMQLRDGGRALDSQTGTTYSVPGCNNICKAVQEYAGQINKKANGLVATDTANASLQSTISSRANTLKNNANKSSKVCNQGTAQGQGKWEAVIGQMLQTATALYGCYTQLTQDPETTDPTSISQYDPTSADYGAGSSYKTGSIGSIGTPTVGSLDQGSDSLPDLELDGEASGKTRNDNLANNNPANSGYPGGMFGGAGNNAGGSSDDDGARGSASYASKTNELIGGYKQGKNGGGGSSGFGGTGSKGFKPFNFKNEEKTKNKNALAALTQMMKKQGISLDISESIFVRQTKRFVNSSIKEGLYDASRNQKLWMDK